MDETSDIANKEHVSIVIRHLSKDFIIIESFVGFVDVDSTTNQDFVVSLDIHLDNCAAQVYDGASNMRGEQGARDPHYY